MIETIKTYFETLEGLSTEELDRSIEKLVRAEKRNVALMIAHIAEMSRRRGHVERGYKSLFDYCTKRLNLSEGSVARRLQVANVSRRFPQILVALAENRLSLTVAGLLAPVLTEVNVERLLSDCAEMSSREVEEYIVALRPKPVFTPSIRKTPSPPASPLMLQVASPEPSLPTPRPVLRMSPNILEPARPETFNFRFAADRGFKEKFERLAEVLGVENPLLHMAEIMEKALDIALDKKDVKRKLARRLERKPRKTDNSRQRSRAREISRYIPSRVRERIHERAGYQCEYRAKDGTRCGSRTGLEIEHLRPFALYRSHDEQHLMLFCRAHNRLSAEKAFGTAFIQEKIDASRRKPPPSEISASLPR
ncbi:MAG: HNH endonuclease [Vicinamibacteria bacterium]